MAKRTYRERLIKTMSKNIPEYGRILDLILKERPYRLPAGTYPHWPKLVETIAASIAGYIQQQFGSMADQLYCYRMALWLVQDAPVYCVSTQLINQLWETDIEERPSLLEDIAPEDSPTILFVLPKGCVKTLEGHEIDHLLFHITDRNNKPASEGEAFGIRVPYLSHEFEVNFSFSTIDADCCVWFSGWTMKDGRIVTQDKDLGSDKFEAGEKEWLHRMRSLILQFLLVMKYEPELIEALPQPRPKQPRGGKASTSPSTPPYRRPRILTAKPLRTVTRKPHQGGTHASPRPYWKLLDPERNSRWKFRRWIRVNSE